MAAADHRMARRRPHRRRGRNPARSGRGVSAQHREPAAPVAEVLPPLRRRRHDPYRRLPGWKSVLPQSIRSYRRTAGGGRSRRRTVAGPGRTRADRQARPRLGRANVDEGRIEHRRHRASRHRADQFLPVRRSLPGQPADGRDAGERGLQRELPLRLGRLGTFEGRRGQRRVAVLHLQQASPVHALRRGRCEQRSRASHRYPVAGSAAAARHGIHAELRHSQRLSVVLGSQAPGGRHPPARIPPRHSVAVRGHPAPRRPERHPVVRGRPDVRTALHQRLRGRRRDRARRVLRRGSRPGRQPHG